ncbi:MAG: formylglycine-generating enzyme family protein [Acidobacteriota bacterium]
MDRFVAEKQTQELNLPATVEATAAAGGLLAPVFERERPRREVWLWLDSSYRDPLARTLADEIETALTAHGGSVARAKFNAVPDELFDANGVCFRPREIDEHRDRVRVAVLTDGRQMLMEHRNQLMRADVEARLRELSHWPWLAVVDFSAAGGTHRPTELAALLRRFHICTLAPEQLPAFLGGQSQTGRGQRLAAEPSTFRAWRAVCALPPTRVDKPSRWAAWLGLGLGTALWRLPEYEPLSATARISELEWLRSRELADRSGQVTLFQRAVRFWLDRYDRRLENLPDGDTESPGGQRLRAERAWLLLFDDLSAAVDELWRLHASKNLKPWIAGQLKQVNTLDRQGSFLRLSSRWDDLSLVEQQKLAQMGLGGDDYRLSFSTPGRVWLAVALCAGLCFAGWMGWDRDQLVEPSKPVWPELTFPAIAEQREERTASGDYRFEIKVRGTPAVQATVPLDSTVTVDWKLKLLECSDGVTAAACQDPPAGAKCQPQERWDKEAKMMMVKLCGGAFIMGTADEDPGARLADRDEQPAHPATLSPFWIGKYEVRHGRYADPELPGAQPDHVNYWQGEALSGVDAVEFPAVNVSWFEADAFCRSLGEGYRLPTEAEWEYAARAGTRTPWSFGADQRQLVQNACADSLPCPVGSKRANPWGLGDMHGCVWEWVSDWYGAYREEAVTDPTGPDVGRARVVRGGSAWIVSRYEPRDLRSAVRGWNRPGDRREFRGFRCARGARRLP